MTDKEKFYNRICEVSDEGGVCFPIIDEGCDSYLEDIEVQQVLNEYYPESANDFGILYENYFDSILGEWKKECIKKYIKECVALEKTDKITTRVYDSKKGVIPTYIYNF